MAETSRPLPLFGDRDPAAGDARATRRLPPVAAGPSVAPSSDLPAPPAPSGSGPFVKQAWPLLALLARIIAGAAADRPDQLKGAIAQRIKSFDQALLSAGIDARQIAAARYALCTAIDEAVVTTRWGADSGWAQRSLLSIFHGETWGGEKVFTFIDQALAARDQREDLIEFYHLLLVLGFQGRYRLERDGTAKVDALRDRMFDILQARFGRRPVVPEAVPPQPKARAARIFRYAPVWSVAVVCLLISAILYAWLDYRLTSGADAVSAQFDTIARGPSAGASP